MLFLKHDFYSNFSSSVNAGDNNSIIDMITNETSELIVYKRDELIEFINSVGVEAKENQSDEKIIDKILVGFPKNTKLIKGMAFLIYQNNLQQTEGRDISITKDRAATFRQIDMVASGITGIGDSFEYHPQLRKEFKNILLNKIETKAKIVGDRKIKIRENANSKYIFWGAVILIITVGVIVFVKYKDKLIVKSDAKPDVPITPEVPAPEMAQPTTVETTIPQGTGVSEAVPTTNVPREINTNELPPQAVI